MHRSIAILLAVLAALVAIPGMELRAQSDVRCFPETGNCISGPIRRFWEQNGGLAVFGYPITPLQTETVESWTGPVQWFERDRLEDHSNEGRGVLAGRLGVERLAQQGRPWQFRQLGGSVPGCRGFVETGYYLCGGFLTFWERNGGLARFGFPVTDQIVERLNGRDYTVQYFERRRMEFHPENQPPFDILLGLLGREVREAAGPAAPPPTPTPAPVSQQILLDEPAAGAIVSSPVRVSGRTTRRTVGGGLSFRIVERGGAELGSGSIPVVDQPDGTGRFSTYLAYRAPAGSEIVLELTERDPSSGALIARAERTLRYAPTTAQRITIDQPASGSRVGTRIRLTGRTAIYPSEGDLQLSVIDGQGGIITRFTFLAQGTPGEAASFFLELDIPDQRGRLVTIEVIDVNNRGDLLARAQVNVFAGSSPYP
ncbi:MAG: hypothetical protein OHK0015_09780 [Chloroflexi bacterium OHK40]